MKDSRSGPSAVVMLAGALVVFVLFSVFVLVLGNLPTEPVLPRVSTGNLNEWRQLEASEQELLSSYGWVDEPGGMVHIPIDRAMSIIAEEGVSAIPTPQPPTPTAAPPGS